MNGTKQDKHPDQTLQVALYKAEKKNQSSTGQRKFNNLYVKNFPKEHFTEDDLRQKFDRFGPILSVVIMRDSEEQSKGFGFVCFENPDDAEKALLEMQN